ncbi:MAG: PP2C family serine/threonine-protein phosphatase [Capsulimonadaceae bacterium]|nr:PP2C family serine/threonine-protein phosphatase [Capsulimonadaceae bacterium]
MGNKDNWLSVVGYTVAAIGIAGICYYLIRSMQKQDGSQDDGNVESKPDIDSWKGERVSDPPKWLELEPTDESDPCKHVVQEALDSDAWWLTAASRRGKSHAHKGHWREDAYCLGFANGWSLISVSDGAGSAKLSRVGAKIASRAAIEQLSTSLSGTTDDAEDLVAPIDALRLAVHKAHEALVAEAESRKASIKDFACTLLIVAHRQLASGESVIAHLLIGDGAVFIKYCGNDESTAVPIVLESGDHGISAGETTFLTSRAAEEWDARATYTKDARPLDFLLVLSDGVADDFMPFDKYPKLLTESIAPQVLSYPRDEHPAKLQELIAYEKRGSFDDRTAVLLSRLNS